MMVTSPPIPGCWLDEARGVILGEDSTHYFVHFAVSRLPPLEGRELRETPLVKEWLYVYYGESQA